MIRTLALLAALVSAAADNFAVLVAGSSGYSNVSAAAPRLARCAAPRLAHCAAPRSRPAYAPIHPARLLQYRHHADVCHAQRILVRNGVPRANIITMLYDDVAQDPENPFPGTLFNWPTALGAGLPVDVYADCRKDYTGNDVTAANLLAVLTGGNTSSGGPVLRATRRDRVFVNFVDHGSVGLVAMPVGDFLYADQLLAALANASFKEMVFYMEACESGSMFENLLGNSSIYALTAANDHESSWGCYCPPGDTINGTSLGTCLGDLFSVDCALQWIGADASLVVVGVADTVHP